MDTEQNRIKVSKYRARRQLRQFGYSEQEIAEIVATTDWNTATPSEIAASAPLRQKYQNEEATGDNWQETIEGLSAIVQRYPGILLMVGGAMLIAILAHIGYRHFTE